MSAASGTASPTPAKPSPLDSVHRELGAQFTDFAGWTMPLRYGSELAEHRAVRETAGLFDLSHMAEIDVRGPEAALALDYALVGHLSKVPVGRARYTMLCHSTGGVLDDLVVYRLAADHFMVVANASNAAIVTAELVDRAHGFTVDVVNRSAQTALIAVQGPNSAAIVTAVTTGADVSALKYYASTPARVGAVDVLLARTGYTGEDGFELYCPAADAAEVWQTVTVAGAGHGLTPAGLACRDTLRLEAGMPLYGNELGVSSTPFEAGLGRVVKFEKPADFVGRSALAKRQESGAGTVLVGLAGTGRRAPRSGYSVHAAQGEPAVGTITSGALSPSLGHPIAMAYVDPAVREPGTTLLVDVRGRFEPVEVVPLPFYRRPA